MYKAISLTLAIRASGITLLSYIVRLPTTAFCITFETNLLAWDSYCKAELPLHFEFCVSPAASKAWGKICKLSKTLAIVPCGLLRVTFAFLPLPSETKWRQIACSIEKCWFPLVAFEGNCRHSIPHKDAQMFQRPQPPPRIPLRHSYRLWPGWYFASGTERTP